MQKSGIRRIAAAFAVTTSVLALSTTPAQAAAEGWVSTCSTEHKHCYIGYQHINPTWFEVYSEGFVTGTDSQWTMQFYNKYAGGSPMWIDIQPGDGRTLRYDAPPGDNDGYSVLYKGFPFAKWRLCDEDARRCTAFVTSPF